MVLYRLAHGYKLQSVADLFCVGKSSVHFYTKHICGILATTLYDDYIRPPSPSQCQTLSKSFKEKCGLEQIVGAIDGTHIVLATQPIDKYNPHDYYNRHSKWSILMQAICDDNGAFWDVCCVQHGSTQDATHFQYSSVFKKLKTRKRQEVS